MKTRKNDDPDAIERQLDDARALARREGWEVVGEFSDVVSGRKLTFKDRPRWQEMVARLRTSRADAVLMKSVDRFGRNVRYALDAEDELRETGVLLRFVTQPTLRPEDPKDRLQFYILLAFAEFEAIMISERTRSKLEWLQQEGIFLGHVPKHFERVNKELVPTETARRVAELRHAGSSYDHIAETLGIQKSEAWNVCRFLVVEKLRREALAIDA